MPNWCNNKLTIKCATRAECDAVQALVRGNADAFDFDRIVPMPKCLDIEARGDADAALAAYCLKNGLSLPKAARCLHQRSLQDADEFLVSHCAEASKQDLAYGKVIYDNLVQTGFKTWYEWRCEKWGTKWNADNSDVCVSLDGLEASYWFDTAWCAPIPVVEELSRKFPEAEMVMDSFYESWTCARSRFEGGECVGTSECEARLLGDDGKVYESWSEVPEDVIGEMVREDEVKDKLRQLRRLKGAAV